MDEIAQRASIRDGEIWWNREVANRVGGPLPAILLVVMEDLQRESEDGWFDASFEATHDIVMYRVDEYFEALNALLERGVIEQRVIRKDGVEKLYTKIV